MSPGTDLKDLNSKLMGKKVKDSYHFRKLLIISGEMIQKKLQLPKPTFPPPSTRDYGLIDQPLSDYYDDFLELTKIIGREKFEINDSVEGGHHDKEAKVGFGLFYETCKKELKKRGLHDQLITMVKPLKRMTRHQSMLPDVDLKDLENHSAHILIMWILQAISRTRSGCLALRLLQKVCGAKEGMVIDSGCAVLDKTEQCSQQTGNKCPRTAVEIDNTHIKTTIVNVFEVSRQTVDESKGGFSGKFELDVATTTFQTLDIKTGVFTRQIEFKLWKYCKEDRFVIDLTDNEDLDLDILFPYVCKSISSDHEKDKIIKIVKHKRGSGNSTAANATCLDDYSDAMLKQVVTKGEMDEREKKMAEHQKHHVWVVKMDPVSFANNADGSHSEDLAYLDLVCRNASDAITPGASKTADAS